MLVFIFGALFSLSIIIAFKLIGRKHAGTYSIWYRSICGSLFSACSTMFMLILCEISQAGDKADRALLWKCNTALMLVLLGIITPAIQIQRWVIAKLPRSVWWLSIPIYMIYLLVFRIMSIQLPIERFNDGTSGSQNSWFTSRQDSSACISFVGITTMALLCGISSVSAPYTAFFADKCNFTEVDLDRSRSSLESINDMKNSKDLEISRLRLDIARDHTHMGGHKSSSGSGTNSSSTSKSTSPSASTFSLSRLVNLVRKSDDKENQLRSLLVESNALVSSKDEIEADMANVQQRIAQAQFSKTPRGRLHQLVFAIFAIYCIYRVCNSYLRMGWWFFTSQEHEDAKGGPRDASVFLIASTINRVYPDVGVTSWSRIIGVFMSGAVSAAALNGVLRMCFRIMRLSHRPKDAKAAIHLDPSSVGQVIGVYVSSIATTLRFNLPRSMSGAIMSALVSPLKVSSVQLWNDLVSCVTSSATSVIIMLVNKLGTETTYDDEMGEIKRV